MKTRIRSELTKDQIMPALEHLKKMTIFFQPFTQKQLEIFMNYFKFVGFKEKAQLTRRGEPVDFLGFILKGSAQGIVEKQHKIQIEEGDCLGYMAALKLQGCEVQQIDYFAKEDGYLAFLKLEDLRLLSKREGQFTAFLMKQLSLLTLQSISQQFLGKTYRTQPEISVIETSTKKILHMLDTLGVVEEIETNKKKKKEELPEIKDFRYYWNQLEQRDKRMFVQCCSIVEVDTQQVLARIHQSSNVFFVVLTGELVEFEQSKPGKIFKIGDTIGLKQLLCSESYSTNIMGRCRSLLLRVTQSNLDDILALSGASAFAIISMLCRYEAQILRNTFEKNCDDNQNKLKREVEIQVEHYKTEMKPLSKKDQQSTSQLMGNYFELDTNQLVNKPQTNTIDQHIIAPLYLLDSYKDLIAKRGYQPNEIKDRKDPMFMSGLSIFLRDKMNEQNTQAIQKKEQARKAKKSGKILKDEDDDQDIYLDQQQDLFENMNNDYYTIVEERDKYSEIVYLLEQQIKQMKEDQKTQKEDYQKMLTQMRKMEMHKELIGLDLASQLLIPTDKTLKKKITLFDNYQQQANDNKKFQKTVRVAEKVLSLSYLHKQQ